MISLARGVFERFIDKQKGSEGSSSLVLPDPAQVWESTLAPGLDGPPLEPDRD